jgi:chloramphenicol 3-O phosphotransferase
MRKIAAVYFLFIASCLQTKPQIIFLNGPACAGKTTTAKEIQNKMEKPFLIVGMDSFLAMFPPHLIGQSEAAKEGFYFNKEKSEFSFGKWGIRLDVGKIQAIKALAEAKNNLIIDEVILTKEILLDYARALKNYTILFVGLECPLKILQERELARKYQTPGISEAMNKIVHNHSEYDLKINTGNITPAEAADKIIEALKTHQPEHSIFHELS